MSTATRGDELVARVGDPGHGSHRWVLAASAGLAPVLVLGGLAWLRSRWVVAVVSGPSMQPTYRDGEHLLARRRLRRAVRGGQVVVLRNPRPAGVAGSSATPWLIKRVAAVGGDPAPAGVAGDPARPGGVVPVGYLAVLGDNPARSLDSRHLGCVAESQVVAVVVRSLSRPR